MDAADPVARDLAAALGSGLDGSPLADPVPTGGVTAKLPELLGISEEELRAKYRNCLCRACLEKAATTNSTSEAKANT